VAAGRWRKALRLVGIVLACLVVLAALASLYVEWWCYPKRTTNGALAPGPAAGAFKLSDIPNDHALSEGAVDADVDRLMAEMTLE
jgi:hypothetical protein